MKTYYNPADDSFHDFEHGINEGIELLRVAMGAPRQYEGYVEASRWPRFRGQRIPTMLGDALIARAAHERTMREIANELYNA